MEIVVAVVAVVLVLAACAAIAPKTRGHEDAEETGKPGRTLWLPREDVFVANKILDPRSIRDVDGESPLPDLPFEPEEKVAFFFVDEEPSANWSHRCTWVLVRPSGKLVRVPHIWPPHLDGFQLVQVQAGSRRVLEEDEGDA